MSCGFLAAGPVAFFILTMAVPAGAHLRNAHAGMDIQTHDENEATLQAALETHLSGKSRTWSSPQSGYSGAITPVRTWASRSGHFCRTFVEVVRLPSGRERNSRARACRNDAGIWVRVRG